jgi:anaerobic ribonucleoside-triphosphate reductase activating protein
MEKRILTPHTNFSDKIRIAGIEEESFVDGPGIRLVVFMQGCPHHCPGCHNPETHSYDKGKIISVNDVLSKLASSSMYQGITFSGGEPFIHSDNLINLATEVKRCGYDIVFYSGWTFEELLEKSKKEEEIINLLILGDILVDGKFLIEERSLELRWRGSRNQRIIDIPKSMVFSEAIFYEE